MSPQLCVLNSSPSASSLSFHEHRFYCWHHWWRCLFVDPTCHYNCLLLPLQEEEGAGAGTICHGVKLSSVNLWRNSLAL